MTKTNHEFAICVDSPAKIATVEHGHYRITILVRHCRVPECVGRFTVQFKSNPIHRMVTASAGVQTDLSKVVHPSYVHLVSAYLKHKLPLYISSPGSSCLTDRCSEHKSVGSRLCLPSYCSPSLGDPEYMAVHLLIILIAPGWPGMPWFWELVQLSSEIPLRLPVSTTLLKQSHNQVFHNNPQECTNPRTGLLCESAERIAALKSHQQGPSTSQSGP